MPKVFVHPRRKEVKPRGKNLSKKWRIRKKISRGYIAWRLLRGVIFIVCLTLFFYQSAKFLQIYYKYPTTTKIEFTSPKEFEYPAVTFCNVNPIKRTKFCAEYPDLCQTPTNITKACEIAPSACKDNTLNLVIPKLGFLTNNSLVEVQKAVNKIYYSENTKKEFWEEWAWSIKTSRTIKPVFVPHLFGYFLCFTNNLLLNCTDEPKKIILDRLWRLGRYELNIQSSEELKFGRKPKVRFSIHSPFVPIHPLEEGSELVPGHKYNIYLKLEEENLLSSPYPTDCINYEDSWNEGNPQRPRSQEMCKELCLHSLFEQNKTIKPEFRMLEYPLKLCFGQKCKTSSEDNEILEKCRRDCKPSCRILKYISTITETTVDTAKHKSILDSDYERDKIQVQILLGEREVVVNSHVAVYDTVHLFSYIGGLMGCWLGISIWAFAGIAENIFRRGLQWMERIKKYMKKTSQETNAVFGAHRNNGLKI